MFIILTIMKFIFLFSLFFFIIQLCFKKQAYAHEIIQLTPAEALEDLIEGNERYVNDKCTHLEDSALRREHTAIHGQYPIATVLACSDARVPVETLLDQAKGDIFVIRVAGNIVGSQALGSIDYSLEHIHVPLVVVLGHTKCGAIYSVVDSLYAKEEFTPNIKKLLDPLLSIAKHKCKKVPNPSEEELIILKESLIEQNVWKSVSEVIKSSDVVKEMLENEKLLVIGAVYDIQTGKVNWLGRHPEEEDLLISI